MKKDSQIGNPGLLYGLYIINLTLFGTLFSKNCLFHHKLHIIYYSASQSVGCDPIWCHVTKFGVAEIFANVLIRIPSI